MELDDPEKRRAFRKRLSEFGLEEVQYRLGAGKYSKANAAVVRQWIADVKSGATITDDLTELVTQFEALKERFVEGGSMTGLFLRTEDQAAFEGLFLQAKSLTDEALGDPNDYSLKLVAAYNEGVGGFAGGPSFSLVTQVAEIVRGVIVQVRRRPPSTIATAGATPTKDPYVDPSRLKDISEVHVTNWDFRRLARMCIELNTAYENGNYISVAMLVRGIIDHVPPVFGKTSFAEVANNHGGRSFKGSMRQLDESMRRIADAYLHEQIRPKESLPSAVQVDVRRDLDVLLAEVVRLAK